MWQPARNLSGARHGLESYQLQRMSALTRRRRAQVKDEGAAEREHLSPRPSRARQQPKWVSLPSARSGPLCIVGPES